MTHSCHWVCFDNKFAFSHLFTSFLGLFVLIRWEVTKRLKKTEGIFSLNKEKMPSH